MRHLLTCLLLFGLTLTTTASDRLTPRAAFEQMPDSLLPYLTRNNRLDMLDFYDSRMPAIVQNRLEGHSQLILLNGDSLVVQLSEVLTLTLTVADDEEADGCQQTIHMSLRTSLPSGLADVTDVVYSCQWRRLRERTTCVDC